MNEYQFWPWCFKIFVCLFISHLNPYPKTIQHYLRSYDSRNVDSFQTALTAKYPCKTLTSIRLYFWFCTCHCSQRFYYLIYLLRLSDSWSVGVILVCNAFQFSLLNLLESAYTRFQCMDCLNWFFSLSIWICINYNWFVFRNYYYLINFLFFFMKKYQNWL